jgi:hypothetical protein
MLDFLDKWVAGGVAGGLGLGGLGLGVGLGGLGLGVSGSGSALAFPKLRSVSLGLWVMCRPP